MSKKPTRKGVVIGVASCLLLVASVGTYHYLTRTEVTVHLPNGKITVALPERGYVTIVGEVTEGGRPLQGVELFSQQGVVETDSSGSYVLPYGPARKVTVFARFTKFSGFPLGRSMLKTAEVTPGTVERLDFDFLPGTGTLEGVLLYDGVPVKREKFTVARLLSIEEEDEQLNDSSHETDDSGRFSIQQLPEGTYVVYVWGKGADVEVTVAEGAMVWKDVELNTGVGVSGRIVGLADLNSVKARMKTVKGPELGILSSYVRAVGHMTLVRGRFPENEWQHLETPRIAQSRILDGAFSFSNVGEGVVSFVIGDRCVVTTEIPAEGIDDLVITLPEEWSKPGRIKFP